MRAPRGTATRRRCADPAARTTRRRRPRRGPTSRREAGRGCALSTGRLFRVVGEAVADAADRLDVRACVAELLAEALHVRVDGAGGDVGVDAPDVAEQRGGGLAAVLGIVERYEQLNSSAVSSSSASLAQTRCASRSTRNVPNWMP